MRFDGKVGLVTGAARGIGRATAMGFARRGGWVGVADLDLAAAETVVDEIRSAGGEAVALLIDVRDAASVDDAVAMIMKACGRLDFVHANAFSMPEDYRSARTAEVSEAHWRHFLDGGLTGAFLTIRAALRQMDRRRSGAIVVTSSMSGYRSSPGNAGYAAAKGALLAFVRSVAVEYAARGVRINAVCPGATATPAVTSRPGALEALASAVPMGRAADPEEIANAVLFLGSDLASYITGAALVVDGGLTADLPVPRALPD